MPTLIHAQVFAFMGYEKYYEINLKDLKMMIEKKWRWSWDVSVGNLTINLN